MCLKCRFSTNATDERYKLGIRQRGLCFVLAAGPTILLFHHIIHCCSKAEVQVFIEETDGGYMEYGVMRRGGVAILSGKLDNYVSFPPSHSLITALLPGQQ